MTGLRSSLVLAVLVLLSAAEAHADAVLPPPERCPEGSSALDFCHGPQTCEIAGCESDADCGAGTICDERPLCVREHCCSGRCCGGGCGSPPMVYTHVVGPCGEGGSCEDFGTTCEQRKVCVPGARVDAGNPGLDAGTRPDGGSAVDAGGGAQDAGGSRDAGSAQDAGRRDAGGQRVDAGRDAGGGGAVTGGGCCSVIGARSSAAGGLFVALVGLAAARIARRRR